MTDAKSVYELVGSALCGSLFIAAYVERDKTDHDSSLILGAGVLLLLQTMVCFVTLVSESMNEMLESIKRPLFCAHELFALTLAQAGIAGATNNSTEIEIAGRMILTFLILGDLFITEFETGSKMIASRFFVFVASLLAMVDSFQQEPFQILYATSYAYTPFFVLAFLIAGEYARQFFQDTEFESQIMYTGVITMVAITNFSRNSFTEEADLIDSFGLSRAMQISAQVLLIFGVSMAYYK